ncbi:hypothetical protein NO1_2034, partial [Candidatus Termititenax aidoneus]
GAEGGGNGIVHPEGNANTSLPLPNALGGYTYGDVYLTAGQIIYIVIGGYPGTGIGGYNGGGTAEKREAGYGFSGGGATHIAMSSGVLSSVPQTNVLLVAGGAGGRDGNEYYYGRTSPADEGAGGGGTIWPAYYPYDGRSYAASGSYGLGAYAPSPIAAGGGGYTGGNSGDAVASGRGGSPYIAPSVSNAGGQAGVRSGHGFARITYGADFDTTPPVISHTTATEGWTNIADRSAYTWTAATDDLSGVAGYYVYWGTDSGGTSTALQTGNSYDPSALPVAGIYYLRVQPRDNAGNTGAWYTVLTYLFDPNAPNQTPTTFTPIDWTNSNVPLGWLWAVATDDLSGVAGYNVRWNGATTYQTGTSFTPTALSAAGIYNLEIQTVDNAGNVSAFKTILTYKYDPNAPGQTGTTLTTVDWTNVNASVTARTWTAAADVGTVGTNASGVAGYNVRWNGATTYQTGTSFTPTALSAAGIYNLEVQTVDNAGNVSAFKTILTYKFDNDAPGKSSPKLRAAALYGTIGWTSQNSYEFTWEPVSDAQMSGINHYDIYWGVSNVNIQSPTDQTTDTKYRISGIATSGEYYFLVRAVDNAGNLGEWKIIALYKFDKDNPGQTTTDLGILGWTNQSAYTFNWDPVVDLSGIDHYDVHWSQTEGTSVTHQTAGAAYTASGLSASGTYYLRVRAVDGAGNTGVWKTIARYKYDGAAPDFAPEQTTINWTTQKDCGLISWMAANDGGESGVAGYNIYWGKDASGATVLAQQTGNDEAARSYNPLPCDSGDGVYYLRVQALDNAGNAGAWKTVLVYQYDASAPALPFTNTETEFSDAADRGEFVWTAADDGAGSGTAGYYVYWGVNPNGTSANLRTPTTFDPPPCEEYTYYYLRVQAVDKIGNAGEWKTLLSYAFNSSDRPGISMTDAEIGWTKNADPEAFTWSQALSGGPAISGYYVYWGQDSEGRNPDNFREGSGELERTYDPPTCKEDGYWYLRVQAQNTAGNKGAWATVLTYKYDA